MIYVGIDVGQNGGVVSVDKDSNILNMYTIPKEEKKVDYQGLYNLLKLMQEEQDMIVCIEDVHSLFGMSAKSNFSFGHIKGAKEMACAALDCEYHLVQPKVWQKAVWLPEDAVIKENGRTKDTKATSLNAARRLWPEEDFLATKRSKVPHDGLVDAALIAEYCRIINNE